MSVEPVDRPVSRSSDTRTGVRDLLLARGMCTAGEIAAELGLTAAGVRRHLEAMESDGLVVATQRRPKGARGRPARAFQLTGRGREEYGHGYDRLAGEALEALRSIGGDEAVLDFARQRVRSVLGHIRPASDDSDTNRAAREIAEALSEAGYAASLEGAGNGVQICQHHCPVWNVAERFPELCEAEQEVVSELVGSHVQRLATIAGGNCACTTNIPSGVVTTDDLLATMSQSSGAKSSGNEVERKTR